MTPKIGKAQQVAELRQHARQMSRQAGSLLKMADDLARNEACEDGLGGEISPGPLAYEYEQLLAAMVEQTLAERTRHRSLFGTQMFGNIAWDVLLLVYRNRVQGRRSVPHNLALELGSTVRAVEEQVKLLVAEELFEWCPRFNYIRVSDEGAARVREFFVGEVTTPPIADTLHSIRKCA